MSSISSDPQDKQVFFHVGLGKTGSTYLQHKVFPRLRGVRYIPRRHYRRAADIVAAGRPGHYLVSREFGLEFERKIGDFARRCPRARTIIVLRRHDQWLASQYRRYVKNGWHRSFREFFDLDSDTGLWRREDLCFAAKLRALERCFGSEPLVLFHEELRHDPLGFVARLAAFVGADFDPADIALGDVHASYNEKQLQVMHRVSGIIFAHRGIRAYQSEGWLARRARMLVCYGVLGAARLVPSSRVAGGPLIGAAELEAVRRHYESDWQQCLDCAAQGAPASKPG